jgi:hypothetical protein
LWQAEKRGEITDQSVVPPTWLGLIIIPQYIALFLIFLIDMDFGRVAVVWIGTFILDVLARPILGFIGSILVLPIMVFRKSNSDPTH